MSRPAPIASGPSSTTRPITLRCHHCGRATPLATRCPNCGSPRIRYMGGGTERVEREVRATFLDLRVGRLDGTSWSGGAPPTGSSMRSLAAGSTCSSARAWSPRASTSRTSPWSASCRRTWRSTSPTSARPSGRTSSSHRPWAAPDGVTARPGDPADLPARPCRDPGRRDGDAARFYAAELALRERFGSPPFGRLVKLTVGLPDRCRRARGRRDGRGPPPTCPRAGCASDVIGPAPAYIARRADRWRWNVVLRGDDPAALLEGGLEPPWSVDVDPESLL